MGAATALALFVCPGLAYADETDGSVSAAQSSNTSDASDGQGVSVSGQADAASQPNADDDGVASSGDEDNRDGSTAAQDSQDSQDSQNHANAATTPAPAVHTQGVNSTCGDSGQWDSSSGSASWSSADSGSGCVVTVSAGLVNGSAVVPWAQGSPLRGQIVEIHIANADGQTRLTGNVAGLFSALPNLESLQMDNPGNFDLSGTDGDFSQMFRNDPKLTTVDCSGWTGVAAKKTSMMFAGDTALTGVVLAGWNVGALTDMAHMFAGDKALRSVDCSGWEASAVADMSSVFEGDSALTEIKGLEGLKPVAAGAEGVSMKSMFRGAAALEHLDLSAWKTGDVADMSGMFAGDSALQDLNLSGWNTGKVTDMSQMFAEDRKLTTIDGMDPATGWDTGKVENMESMFSMYDKVSSLPVRDDAGQGAAAAPIGMDNTDFDHVGKWDVSQVKAFDRMFMGLDGLTSLDLSQWKTDSATSMRAMFAGDRSLVRVRGLDSTNPNWNTGKVTDVSYMFYLDGALTSLGNGDLSGWSTGEVRNMEGMFRYDTSLSGISGMDSWDTSKVESMAGMFQRNRKRTDLNDVEEWKTGNVTAMWDMFGGDDNLKRIDVSGWDTSKVTSMTYMFQGTSITSLDLSTWDTTHVVAKASNAADVAACAAGTVGSDSGTCRVLPEYLNKIVVGPKTRLTPEFFGAEPLKNKGYTGRWTGSDNAWASSDTSDASANAQLADRVPGTGASGDPAQTYVWQEQGTISFDPNLPDDASGELSGSLPDDITVSGADVANMPQTIPASSPEIAGYRFAGWNTVWDGGRDSAGNPGHAYASGDSISVSRGEKVVLYAQWVRTGSGGGHGPSVDAQYVVRYDANTPEGAAATGSTADDVFSAKVPANSGFQYSKRALKSNGYKVSGYTFEGWAKSRDANGVYKPGVRLNMRPGVNTLYARWQKVGVDHSSTTADSGNVVDDGVIDLNALAHSSSRGQASSPRTSGNSQNGSQTNSGRSANGSNGTSQQGDRRADGSSRSHEQKPKCLSRDGTVLNMAQQSAWFGTRSEALPYCDNVDSAASSTSPLSSAVATWWWLMVLLAGAVVLSVIAIRERVLAGSRVTAQHRRGDE